MISTVMLEFQDVSKSFHNKTVLNCLSFSLRKGEVLAFLGPSGCGKTTILNMAAGLMNPTSGVVVNKSSCSGYVFQEPRLIPWKTVLENVQFVLHRQQNECKEKVLNVLEQVGLQGAVNSFPNQLSGGMKQRVSIARALVCEPEIIFMDEPFSALDLSLKSGLQNDFIQLIQEKELAVMYVTHDPEEAARLADRVFIFSPKSSIVKEMVPKVPRCCRNENDIQDIKQSLHSYIIGDL